MEDRDPQPVRARAKNFQSACGMKKLDMLAPGRQIEHETK
jgi:hypothetical protein